MAEAIGRTRSANGTSESPYSPERMASALRLVETAWAGSSLLWLEERSDQGVLCLQDDPAGAPRDLTEEHSVQARIGYGGGEVLATRTDAFYVAQGRIWRRDVQGGPARPLTPAEGESASPAPSPGGGHVAYVHESGGEISLLLVDAEGRKEPRRLAAGRDFYMQPAWHPGGAKLAYVAWDHPQMPWTGSEIELLDLAPDGEGLLRVTGREVVAGGPAESVFQPLFSPDGTALAFVSDRSGFWNVEILDLRRRTRSTLVGEAAEHALPAWRQGMRTLAFSASGEHLYYLRNEGGAMSMHLAEIATGRSSRVAGELEPYLELGQIAVCPSPRGGEDAIALLASGPALALRVAVVQVDPGSPGEARVRVARRSEAQDIPSQALSSPRALQWPAGDGEQVHGLYYPPPSCSRQGDGAPPLVVSVHGGPTGQSRMAYSAQVQFLATRGYAVLAVNYRGSAGYGRAYRERLDTRWGEVDVEDAISGARHLIDQGLADGGRMVVMGASAGGYTVLRCLAVHPGAFRAGISIFGISNLFTMAEKTHKLESHYLDTLIGPLPETAARYRERSPLFSAEAIVDPIALYQGEVDRVVPRDQADSMAASLRARGVPHIYEIYPGEGHGWRKSATIKAFYESLDGFLHRHLVYA